MVSRSLRLRRPADFQRVRRNGRSWSTPHLVLIAQPNELGQNRYGFAVGRRIGNAVQRNRIKRWMREASRRLHPSLRQGHDIVLIARGRMADPGASYDIIEQSLGILAGRAELLAKRDNSAVLQDAHT